MNAATYKSWTPIGYARYATLSSAVTLDDTPTAGTAITGLSVNGLSVYPQHAIIDIEDQNVRVRDDGTAPTSTEGQLVRSTAQIVIEDSPNILKNIAIIEAASGAVITVRYFV